MCQIRVVYGSRKNWPVDASVSDDIRNRLNPTIPFYLARGYLYRH